MAGEQSQEGVPLDLWIGGGLGTLKQRDDIACLQDAQMIQGLQGYLRVGIVEGGDEGTLGAGVPQGEPGGRVRQF